jgi:hypothetical protein
MMRRSRLDVLLALGMYGPERLTDEGERISLDAEQLAWPPAVRSGAN